MRGCERNGVSSNRAKVQVGSFVLRPQDREMDIARSVDVSSGSRYHRPDHLVTCLPRDLTMFAETGGTHDLSTRTYPAPT